MASVSEEAEKNGELTRAQGKEFTAGKFFCITEDVWSVGVKKSKPEHWDAFWREGGNVSIQLRQDDPNSDPYTITRNALNAGVTAAPPKSTRSESIGSSLTRKKEIWPVDIVGVPAGRFSGIANLLPAGHVVHEEWFGVAAAVLGLPKTASVLEQLMACRGVRKEYPNDDVDASNKEDTKPAADPMPAPNGGKTTLRSSARITRSASKAPPATPVKKQNERKRRELKPRPAAAASANAPTAKKRRKTSAPKPPPAAVATVNAPKAKTQNYIRKRGGLKKTLDTDGPPNKKGENGESTKAAAMEVAGPPKNRKSAKKGAGKLSRRISFGGNASQGTESTRSSVARKLRVDNTGVVHFVFNKLRLNRQGLVLDGDRPTMLYVPCMTLQEAKGWRGEGYKALVLAGFPDGITNIPQSYLVEEPGLVSDRKNLAWETMANSGMNSIQLQEKYENTPKMSQEEKAGWLEKARLGLEKAVLGLAEYVKQWGELGEDDLECLKQSNRYLLKERSSKFSDLGVPVPKALPVPTKPVLFVDFGGVGESNAHPAPDPELLFAKAGTVWGMLNDVAILANGKPEDEEDSDSLDEEAEEVFCDNFRNTSPIPNEISVMVTTPRHPSVSYGH